MRNKCGVFSFDDIRLTLLNLDNANDFYNLVDKNRDFLSPWFLWVNKCISLQSVLSYLSNYTKNYQNGTCIKFAIYHKEKMIGVISLNELNHTESTASIGYWVDKQFQGRGIITKSCVIMISSAFNMLNFKHIFLYCAVNNYKSSAIPLRLGFIKSKETFTLYDYLNDIIKPIESLFYYMPRDLWKMLFKIKLRNLTANKKEYTLCNISKLPSLNSLRHEYKFYKTTLLCFFSCKEQAKQRTVQEEPELLPIFNKKFN